MAKFSILAVAAILGLSACGETVGEQALMGAGAGALATAATGGDPVLGAVGGGGAFVLYCKQNPGKCT